VSPAAALTVVTAAVSSASPLSNAGNEVYRLLHFITRGSSSRAEITVTDTADEVPDSSI
jgi:hypothetical protein